MLINFPVEEYEAYAKYYISYYEEGKKSWKNEILKDAKHLQYKSGPWYRKVSKALSNEELSIIENATIDTYKGFDRSQPIYDFLFRIHLMEDFYKTLNKEYIKIINVCGMLQQSDVSTVLLNEDEYLQVTRWKQATKNL